MCVPMCGTLLKGRPVAQSRILTPTMHRKQAHLQSHTISVREWELYWPAKVLSGGNSGCATCRRRECLLCVRRIPGSSPLLHGRGHSLHYRWAHYSHYFHFDYPQAL